MSEPGGLLGELAEQTADQRPEVAAPPRLREPQRDQLELRVVDLDSLLPLDHPARAVWAYAEQLDLNPLLDAIKAREGAPGHPPAHPQVPMALWLYATIDAVGSARALARLCETRMSSEDGKAVYRQRAKAECVNADLRNRGFQRLLLRGRDKVRAVLLWFAVAHNLMRAVALRAAAAKAAAVG